VRGTTKFWLMVTIMLALLISPAAPVLAQVKGEPELEATIVGGNEFQVGQLGALQIMLQNKGTFSGEMEDPDDEVMALGYLNPMGVTLVPPCTTAVSITATLESGSRSIEVLNETAAVGTLASGRSTMQPIVFQIRIAQDAKPGTYELDLELEYEYLEDVDWLNPPEEPPPYKPQFEFEWDRERETTEISIRVVGTYFSVGDIETEGIRVGATGIISATIENSGAEEATEVTAEIVPGGNFVPMDKGVFLDDLRGGKSKAIQFKVAVSPEAISKTSPLDIVIKYKDENEIPRQTIITVGVPIGAAERDFLVTSMETKNIRAGATGIIRLTLRNNAAGEARDVTAEIVPGGHFVPVDRASFLGDIDSGNSATTEFKVSVSEDAIVKTSPLDILVKYRDENDVPRQALITVGVPVEKEPDFAIQSVRIGGNSTPGAKAVIEVVIKNASDYDLENVTARINPVDPFSTTDDTAYIGTLRAGESGIAKFRISIDDDALPKAYALDVEVKYWDSQGNSYISKPIKTTVRVESPTGPSMQTIILISVIVIAIAGIVYYLTRRRKRPIPQKAKSE